MLPDEWGELSVGISIWSRHEYILEKKKKRKRRWRRWRWWRRWKEKEKHPRVPFVVFLPLILSDPAGTVGTSAGGCQNGAELTFVSATIIEYKSVEFLLLLFQFSEWFFFLSSSDFIVIESSKKRKRRRSRRRRRRRRRRSNRRIKRADLIRTNRIITLMGSLLILDLRSWWIGLDDWRLIRRCGGDPAGRNHRCGTSCHQLPPVAFNCLQLPPVGTSWVPSGCQQPSAGVD